MGFGLPSPLTGALGRRLSLSLGVVTAFVAVDLLLIAGCLFVLRQNVALRSEVTDAVALLTPAKGTVVPQLDGRDWTGVPRSIAYGQDPRPTLVYTFTKACGHCEQNFRAMRSLQALAPRWLRCVYIDTVRDTFTPQYLADRDVDQTMLLVELYPAAAVAYDTRAVPELVLVDRNGRVQWSHVGELSPSDITKALSLIGRH